MLIINTNYSIRVANFPDTILTYNGSNIGHGNVNTNLSINPIFSIETLAP